MDAAAGILLRAAERQIGCLPPTSSARADSRQSVSRPAARPASFCQYAFRRPRLALPLVTGRPRGFAERYQPLSDRTSRMNREVQVRMGERPWMKIPRAYLARAVVSCSFGQCSLPRAQVRSQLLLRVEHPPLNRADWDCLSGGDLVVFPLLHKA